MWAYVNPGVSVVKGYFPKDKTWEAEISFSTFSGYKDDTRVT